MLLVLLFIYFVRSIIYVIIWYVFVINKVESIIEAFFFISHIILAYHQNKIFLYTISKNDYYLEWNTFLIIELQNI